MLISVNKLLIRAFHGVLPQERIVGQDFEVSVTISVPDYDGSDSLSATVNYAELCDLIALEMQKPSNLIEHAAYRIGKAIREKYPQVNGGSVTLAKIAPPIPHQLNSASVLLNF